MPGCASGTPPTTTAPRARTPSTKRSRAWAGTAVGTATSSEDELERVEEALDVAAQRDQIEEVDVLEGIAGYLDNLRCRLRERAEEVGKRMVEAFRSSAGLESDLIVSPGRAQGARILPQT